MAARIVGRMYRKLNATYFFSLPRARDGTKGMYNRNALTAICIAPEYFMEIAEAKMGERKRK